MKYTPTYQMKTSELIALLQEKLKTNGDLPVRFGQDENEYDDMGDTVPAGGVMTIMESDDTPCYEVVMTSFRMAEMSS